MSPGPVPVTSMQRVIVAFGRESYEHGRFRDQGARAVEARVGLTVRQTMFSLAVNMTTAAWGSRWSTCSRSHIPS